MVVIIYFSAKDKKIIDSIQSSNMTAVTTIVHFLQNVNLNDTTYSQ